MNENDVYDTLKNKFYRDATETEKDLKFALGIKNDKDGSSTVGLYRGGFFCNNGKVKPLALPVTKQI
jgi:hypothetical protein